MLIKQEPTVGKPFDFAAHFNFILGKSNKISFKNLIYKKLALFLNPKRLLDEILYLYLKKSKSLTVSNKITSGLIDKIKTFKLHHILNPTIEMAFDLTLDIGQTISIVVLKKRNHDFLKILYFIKQDYSVDQYSFTIPICSNWERQIVLVKRDVLSPFGSVYFPESVLANGSGEPLAILYIRDFLKNKISYNNAKIVSCEVTPNLSVVK